MTHCEPCVRKGKKEKPAKWCVECEEFLCSECHRAHSSMKALLKHRIVDAKMAKESPGLKNTAHQLCKKHNMQYEFICPFHDCICCQACVSQDHRTCAKVVPLEIAAKGEKISSNVEELLSQLQSIYSTVDEIRQAKVQNIQFLEVQENSIRSKVANIRQKVIERINTIEKDLLKELSKLKKDATSKLEVEARKIQNTGYLINSYQERLESEKQRGSDKQLFLAIHDIRQHMIGIEERVFRMKSRTGLKSITFRENENTLETFNTFGSISLQTEGKTIHFTKEQQRHTDDDDDTESFIQRFDFSYKFDLTTTSKNAMITGLAITDDSRLLLCGGGNNNIIVCTLEGKHVQDCKLTGEPWDVAIVSDRDKKAVATLPYLYAIQFINMYSMTSGKTVKFDWRVYGIAVLNNTIIVGGKNCLHVLDTDGTKLNNIPVPSVNVFYIHPRESGDLYYSDNTYVYCVKTDGRHVFCQDLPDLQGPRNIVTDMRGNMYVAGHRSHNIHRLSADGIALDVLLSKDDCIEGPFNILFSRDQKKLFISNNSGKTILVFTTTYAPPSKEREVEELLKYLSHDT